jgi:hypothetical protein
VEYQPRKKVIIHEYSHYDNVEELLRNSFVSAPPGAEVGPLKWVDGIVLVNTTYPMRDTVIKELIEGRLHWDHVSFAVMPEYLPNIHLNDPRITANLINVTSNPTFRIIAEFIRENFLDVEH